MAPSKAVPFDSSQVVYNDLVIMDFSRDPEKGFPIKSFSCQAGQHDMTEQVDLCKAYINDIKLKAVSVGDPIPNLKLGRVCARKNSTETVIDYQFLSHKLGIAGTPQPDKDNNVMVGALDSIAKENKL